MAYFYSMVAKWISIITITSYLLAGCTNNTSKNKPIEIDSAVAARDTVVAAEIVQQENLQAATEEEPEELGTPIVSLLNNPLNLVEFKKTKKSSNSGVQEHRFYYYKPDTIGIYYSYFLFPSPRDIPETKRFRGARVTVYKYGKKIGFFSDTNEELIEAMVTYPDEDFGALDMVGTKQADIEKLYGQPDTTIGNSLVYHHATNVLTLEIEAEKVVKVKYTKLSSMFDKLTDKEVEALVFE